MNNILEYKGYHTKIVFDNESKTLHGQIEGIRDLVNFESNRIDNIEQEFYAAVDDYLDFCCEVGKEPDKEYKGSFNIRISPELHKKAAMLAYRNEQSLNQIVEDAIEAYVDDKYVSDISIRETVATLTTAATAFVMKTSSSTIPTPNIRSAYSFQQNDTLNLKTLQ